MTATATATAAWSYDTTWDAAHPNILTTDGGMVLVIDTVGVMTVTAHDSAGYVFAGDYRMFAPGAAVAVMVATGDRVYVDPWFAGDDD